MSSLFSRPLLFVAAVNLAAITSAFSAQAIPGGSASIKVDAGGNAITVFTYKPKSGTNGPLLLVFHGINRNAEEYRDYAIPLAERLHALVAAPLFDKERFPGDAYTRGGVMKGGAVQSREAWTFSLVPVILRDIRGAEGRSDLDCCLVGHSAGAQFVMRLAALAPVAGARYVAANPGTDLFPRRDWEFGFGFGGLPAALSDDAALRRYLELPLTLCLGTADVDPNHKYLDHSETAMKQGRFRLERGRACFSFADDLAKQRGWPFQWRKVEIPGIAHDGKGMLAADAIDAAILGQAAK